MQTKFGMAVNIGNRGNALADIGDFDAALNSFDEAETLNREMGNKFLISLNIGDRGGCRLKMGRHEQARDALRKRYRCWTNWAPGTARNTLAFNPCWRSVSRR